MSPEPYSAATTALVVIDPYNDFISEGGKVWERLRAVAEANRCIENMRKVLEASRRAKLSVFYALHHRYRTGDFEQWNYVAPVQRRAWQNRTFEFGTWGGEIRTEFAPQPGDTIAQEHWCSSGFANTDLDLLLKRRGIQRVILVGLIAHTCLEATARFAAELGYDVTVVKDATADYSEREMEAAIGINLPNYAGAILTADELLALVQRT